MVAVRYVVGVKVLLLPPLLLAAVVVVVQTPRKAHLLLSVAGVQKLLLAVEVEGTAAAINVNRSFLLIKGVKV